MSLNRPSSQEHFDRSGTIAADAPSTLVFERNPHRIGAYFQNNTAHDMWLQIIQSKPDVNQPTLIKVVANSEWYYDQFAPINEIHVTGTPGDTFSASEFGI